MNRALAFDKSHYLPHCVLGWNRNHHVHVIGHQVSLLDPTLRLYGELAKQLSQILAQLPVQRLAPVLGNEVE